jgi:hypothetical protein
VFWFMRNSTLTINEALLLSMFLRKKRARPVAQMTFCSGFKKKIRDALNL